MASSQTLLIFVCFKKREGASDSFAFELPIMEEGVHLSIPNRAYFLCSQKRLLEYYVEYGIIVVLTIDNLLKEWHRWNLFVLPT